MDYFLFNFSGVQFHYTMSPYKKITEYINSMRGVGAWRVLKGDAVK